MTELVHLIEYVSTDVVLIGLVFSLFLALSKSIWEHRRLGVAQGVSNGLGRIVNFAGDRSTSWVYLVGIVLVASQMGTILVRLSDEILDSDDALRLPIFLYVPEIGDIGQFESWRDGDWDEEDRLKLRVLEDTLERADFSLDLKELLRRHLPPPEGFCFPPKGNDDCAKGFFQHANAVVLSGRGSDDQREQLRREKYTVYLLSVMFVGTWILLFATLAGPMSIAAWRVGSSLWTVWTKGGVVATLAGANRNAWVFVGQVFVALILLWLAEGLILRLWTEQSVRYNRRLVHAYVDIAGYGDGAMDIAGSESRRETN